GSPVREADAERGSGARAGGTRGREAPSARRTRLRLSLFARPAVRVAHDVGTRSPSPGDCASKGVRIRGYRFRRGCVEGFPGTDPTPGLRADIFRPQGRMGPNEPCHQLLAPRVLKHFHRYPTAAK